MQVLKNLHFNGLMTANIYPCILHLYQPLRPIIVSISLPLPFLSLSLTRVLFQKSSLTENWPSSCSRASSGGDSALRYIVYKQPLSLDRFFIHDVTPHESAASKLEAAFVLVNLNRFQQIVTVCTFQAQTEQIKVRN